MCRLAASGNLFLSVSSAGRSIAMAPVLLFNKYELSLCVAAAHLKNIIVMAEQVVVNKSNGMGVAGFVLALLGVIFIWVPALNWILWLLGLIFSIIGVCRAPRGLAIAGLVLSAIYLIILFVVISALFAAASAL